MPVANCWDLDFVGLANRHPKEIRHVDGILSYDGNTGTAPALGDYVIGGTSDAVGRVIAGSDLGGTSATGTLTLTDITKRFLDNETLRVLSRVGFDTVANGGFKVGDTITGPTTESIDVKAIEYNLLSGTPGAGHIFGNNLTTGFANNEQLDVSGGASAVALVDSTLLAAETDNSGLFTTCFANGFLVVPGTTNTNNSIIVHYDGGTIVIPKGAKISDTTTGANGIVQQVVGALATGSLRLIDSDTTGGAWTDNNGIDIEDVVFYNAQVAGQVFSPGDLVRGITSGEEFRVLAVINDGDSTGKIISAGKTGTLTLNEDLHLILPGFVLGAKVAQVESIVTVTLAAATLNLPNGVRTLQRDDQGGLFSRSASLNIVRDWNEFYSYVMDTFDELSELDDLPPLFGDVRNQLYTIINAWRIPDLSMRFLQNGSAKDSGNANVWTNYRSILSGVDVTDNGLLQTAATNRTPMPDAYAEQDALVINPFWLEGPFDVQVKVKTSVDPEYIDPATPGLGQEIDASRLVWRTRPMRRKYAVFATQVLGGITSVPLRNDNDPDNPTGTHTVTWDTGSAATLLVGEEFTAVTADVEKRGVVTAQTGDAGATGSVAYVLKSGTQFANNDACTAVVSGKTFQPDAAPTNVVAGYGTNVKEMTVDRDFTGGTVAGGPFVIGETVTQTGTGATGYFMENDANTLYVMDATGTFNGTGLLTGGISGATYTPTATATATTVPKDTGVGGDFNYNGVISGDITDASPQTIAVVYEWLKYVTARESTRVIGGPGTGEAGVEGRLFRRLVTTYLEQDTAPIMTFAAPKGIAAQGWFIDKDTLASVDLQNNESTDVNGISHIPPNLQIMEITGMVSGDRGALYRSATASTVIQRTEFQVGVVGSGNNQAANSTILLAAQDRSVSPTPDDVPDSGILRIEDPALNGVYLRFPYSSVNRSTNIYTLASGTIGDVTGALDLVLNDNAHVVFVEEQAAGTSVNATVQYAGANINLVVVTRLKGLRPFIGQGLFTSTGFSTTAIRDPDGVVNLP